MKVDITGSSYRPTREVEGNTRERWWLGCGPNGDRVDSGIAGSRIIARLLDRIGLNNMEPGMRPKVSDSLFEAGLGTLRALTMHFLRQFRTIAPATRPTKRRLYQE